MRKTGKIFFFYLIAVLLVVVTVDILAQITYFIIFKEVYSFQRLPPALDQEKREANRLDDFLKNEIIHPYLGFVLDSGNPEKNLKTQGFNTSHSPLVPRNPQTITIAILGGSVAGQIASHVENSFKKHFHITPTVICLALGGYKQPQQLLALSYFIALGAHYDLVVNIDGFNEVVLSDKENYRSGVNFAFPRYWNLRISRKPSKQALSLIGKIKYLRDRQQEAINDLSTGYIRYCASYGLYKMLSIRWINREVYRANSTLFELQEKVNNNFEESGPFLKYDDENAVYNESASLWINCSILMNNLTKNNGGEYYHFFQPNQYFHNSKKLTREEMATAFLKDGTYRQAVIAGYPIFLQKSKVLIENNINFFDATMIFKDVQESIYIDNCCHYNSQGKDIFADYIVQEISSHTRLTPLLKKPID